MPLPMPTADALRCRRGEAGDAGGNRNKTDQHADAHQQMEGAARVRPLKLISQGTAQGSAWP